MGQARGVVLLAAAQAGLHVYEYKPAEVKQALSGYGNADKRQMQEMVRMLLTSTTSPGPTMRQTPSLSPSAICTAAG